MLNSITEKYKESLAKDNDNNHQAKILQGPNLRPIVSDRKAFWETPEKVKTHGVWKLKKKSQTTLRAKRATYVGILSGQKLIKNAKICLFYKI